MKKIAELKSQASSWPQVTADQRDRGQQRLSRDVTDKAIDEDSFKLCLYTIPFKYEPGDSVPPKTKLFNQLQALYFGNVSKSNDSFQCKVDYVTSRSDKDYSQKTLVVSRVPPLESEASYRSLMRTAAAIVITFRLEDKKMARRSIEELIAMKELHFCPLGMFCLVGLKRDQTSISDLSNDDLKCIQDAKLEPYFFVIDTEESLEDLLPAITYKIFEKDMKDEKLN